MGTKARTIRVRLTEAQLNALAAAVDDHGQHLVDNAEADPRMRAQLVALGNGWSTISRAWIDADPNH
jgi:hypothetical protein